MFWSEIKRKIKIMFKAIFQYNENKDAAEVLF